MTLRTRDKSALIHTGRNPFDPDFLFSFVRMNDFVVGKLAEALKASGLNPTEAMICSDLARRKTGGSTDAVGVSLRELTRKLAAPRARLHAQLKQLVQRGLVRQVKKDEDDLERGPRYMLTALGQRRVEIFIERGHEATAEISQLLFYRGQRRLESWIQMNRLLLDYLSTRNE